jgi:uncharacterized protein
VGQKVVTLDSSAIFALLNKKDAYHLRVRRVLSQYFLEDIKAGLFCLDFATTDIARAQELANKYQNLPLGLTDAFVIACAERSGGAVQSLDEHFWNGVWRGEAEKCTRSSEVGCVSRMRVWLRREAEFSREKSGTTPSRKWICKTLRKQHAVLF